MTSIDHPDLADSWRMLASGDETAGRPADGAAGTTGQHAWFGICALGCAGLLLALLWGGLALQLSFDKAQTSYHASLNVANLSQVVDEHLAGVIGEIDQGLLAARREYERDGPGIDLGVVPMPNLGPEGGVARIEVIDAAGRLTAIRGTSGGAAANRAEAVEALAAHSAADTDRLFIGRPVRSQRNGETRWEIPISRRLGRADGSFAGVVLAAVDSSFLSAVFDKVNIGRDGFIAVVGADDFVVRACSTVAGPMAPLQDTRNSPLPQAVAEARAGAFADASPVDGTPRIVGYRVLRRYPLIIEIGASKAELLGPYRTRRDWLLLTAGMISIVIVCITALLLRQDARRRTAEAALLQQTGELRRSRHEAEFARAAAHAADHAKSEFLANMSHELRTPLNAIIGYSEIMSGAILGPMSEKYRDYAESIYSAGGHLLKIINDILDLSKVEAGRLELHDEDTGVAELFDTCRRMVAERAIAAGVALELCSTELGLRADPLRLKQMLLNLLSNAIKFTPAGGDVTAFAELSPADEVMISVRDTGIGIKPEDIERALEPFGQVVDTAMRSMEGTGLGLPLVRRLAELHGGRMILDSRPDVGTTVTLIFPPARTVLPSPAALAAVL